jgi:hypothetical protein
MQQLIAYLLEVFGCYLLSWVSLVRIPLEKDHCIGLIPPIHQTVSIILSALLGTSARKQDAASGECAKNVFAIQTDQHGHALMNQSRSIG